MTVRSESETLPAAPAFDRRGQAAFVRDIRSQFYRLRLVFALAAAYCLVAAGLALVLAGEQRIAPFSYVPIWLRGGFSFGFLYLMALTLPRVLRERPDRPLSVLWSRVAEYATPAFVAGVALIAMQAFVMGTFTSTKNMLPLMADFTWDGYWASVDAALHGGIDPWRLLLPVVDRPWALHLVEIFYFTGWMLMLGIVPAIVAFSPRMERIRVRFFLTYILCWILLGNILAAAGMSAGPVYFGEITGDYARFGPLVDRLAANSGSFLSAYDIQQSLWYVHERGMSALGSGISAFPSLHIAMATLWVIVGFAAGRKYGVAALAFLATVQFGSVALGWHYAIDGYASIVLTLLLWAAVGWALRRAWPRD